MADPAPGAAGGEAEAEEPEAKRRKVAEAAEDDDEEAGEADGGGGPKRVKRKMAIVLGYLGAGYRGLMINYEIEEAAKVKSVEHVLRDAMVRAGLVTRLNAERLEQKIGWSRSSRTDAGVSAVRLIISARFLVAEDTVDVHGRCPALPEELNKELPSDVRCFGAIRVPRSFDAKRSCSWREYEYLLPLDMARPPAGSAGAGQDVAAVVASMQRAMRRFEGCHSFHNFSRLKASDLAWKSSLPADGDEEAAPSEAGGGAKGRQKGKKGGKGKGGKGGKKGQKGGRKGGAEAEEEDAAENEGAAEKLPESLLKVLADEEDAPEAAPAAAAPAGAEGAAPRVVVEPPWVEICAKDPTSGAWKQRHAEVLKHTQSTMWMCAVEPTLGGAFLRVRLRGQFFLYNQIRLMVGSAAAVSRGVLPEELLDLALRLPVEMHMPLAPPTGLFQRTSGFSMLDPRAGFAAMDAEQAALCMLPDTGFVLLDEAGTSAAEAFTSRVEEEVARLWRESGEAEAWLKKVDTVRVPPEAALAELRALAVEAERAEVEARKQQGEADQRRRRTKLEDGSSFNGVLPRRFATALMVRFGLIPGWRVGHVQRAVAARLRRWEREPGERPPGMSSPPTTEQLLDFIASTGPEALAQEGAGDCDG